MDTVGPASAQHQTPTTGIQANGSDELITSDELSRFRVALARLARAIRFRSEDELTHAQVAVLLAIRQRQPVSAGELAASELVAPSSMTRTLSRLAERGLISRRSDERDGRVSMISLTDEGAAEWDRVWHVRNEWLFNLLMGLSTPEIHQVLGVLPVLERLATAVDPTADVPPHGRA